MSKWIKQPVKIALYTDSTNTDTRLVRIYPAWVCGEFAVHNQAYSETIYDVGVWTVTHLATGAALCCANSRHDAIHAAQRLIHADIAWPASLDFPAHERVALREEVIATLESMLRDGRVTILSQTEQDAYEYACHLYNEGKGLLLSAYLSDLKETQPNLWWLVNARVARYIDAWESEIQAQERGG